MSVISHEAQHRALDEMMSILDRITARVERLISARLDRLEAIEDRREAT